MLCRLGNIKKQDIGSIRITQDHTLVEISPDKAEQFASCASATDPDEITVEPAAAPRKGGGGGGGPRPAYADRKPKGGRSFAPRREGASKNGSSRKRKSK